MGRPRISKGPRALTAVTTAGRQNFLAELPLSFWYAAADVAQQEGATWFDLLRALRDERLETKHGVRVDDRLARALWDEYWRQSGEAAQEGAA